MLVGWEAGSDTVAAMADFGYAVPRLVPGLPLHSEPERRQLTLPTRVRGRIGQRGPAGPTSPALDPHPSQQPLHPKGRALLRPHPLDATHSQLGRPNRRHPPRRLPVAHHPGGPLDPQGCRPRPRPGCRCGERCPRRAAPPAVVDGFSGAATRLDASWQRRDLGVRPSAIGILCRHLPTSDGLQRAWTGGRAATQNPSTAVQRRPLLFTCPGGPLVSVRRCRFGTPVVRAASSQLDSPYSPPCKRRA
jgi:hypothetical protein